MCQEKKVCETICVKERRYERLYVSRKEGLWHYTCPEKKVWETICVKKRRCKRLYVLRKEGLRDYMCLEKKRENFPAIKTELMQQ